MIEGSFRLYFALKKRSFKELTFPIGHQVFAPTVVNQNVDIYNENKETEYYKYKPGKHWDSRGHHYTYNSAGFHDNEFKPYKEPGIFRIISMGGSSTAEECVPDNKTWSDYLEVRLNSRSRGGIQKFEVNNFGMGGYGLRHIYNLLSNEVLSYQPDAIIIYSVANNTGYRDSTIRIRSKFGLARSHAFGVLYGLSLPFHRTVNAMMEKRNQQMMTDKGGSELLSNAEESYDRYLYLIINLCKRNKIRLILVPEPRGHPLFTQYNNYMNKSDQELVKMSVESEAYSTNEAFNYSNFIFYNHMMLANHMTRIGKENGIQVVNVYPRIRTELLKGRKVFLDFIHLTEEGGEILADEIANQI